MPDKDFDILIYVPLEEEKLSQKDLNWITTFEKILNVGIKQITKQKINLSKSFYQKEKDIKAYDKYAGIIQLIVDNNFNSGFLINEQVDKERVIQVLCQPDISISDQYIIINLFDEYSSKGLDLTEDIGSLKNEIWLKFLDIAYEIRDNLIVDKQTNEFKGKIYVAETSSDQNSNRETIIRELEHIGYKVLPDANFPKDMMQFSDLVSANMKECFLSIHLIGNNYAPLLNNIEISSIELQNDIFHEVAAELKAENKIIRRLVWIHPDVKPKSEKQRLYIESFKRNIELLENTEIVQTPIEVFKNIIRTKAVDIIQSSEMSSIKEDKDQKEKTVYVISNEHNGSVYSSIKKELEKHKFKVLESTAKDSKIDLIQEHYYNLVHCDALLIDYSIHNNQWINSKLSDIMKSPGFGRKKDFLAKAVLINTDKIPDVNLNISDLMMLDDKKKSISEKINSFIEKID
ncbi:MAG: hypothetical protein KQH79_10455 [Bacteroidetes bacterium]|nr:hypothetical protein [Bacteroidota bacterium]